MHQSIVLIPTYNERQNIAVIVAAIFSHLPETEVLVIDDNSPDGTADVVRELQPHYPRLSLLLREQKQGLGAAYIHAFRELQARDDIEYVISMDADLSHDPADLPRFTAAIQDVDFVIGSRYVQGGGVKNWESHRRFLSRLGNMYARTLLRLDIRDVTSGFGCYRKKVLDALPLHKVRTQGYAFLIDLKTYLSREGRSFREIPIIFHGRREGESKISPSIIWEGLGYPFRWLWSRAPER